MSAADLGAAYRADAKTADAKYRDHWVRVTGPVTAVGTDGTTFELDAGGAIIDVHRATRGRLSVPVRKGSRPVTVTGKCQGLSDPAAGATPRIVLADATVARPAAGK